MKTRKITRKREPTEIESYVKPASLLDLIDKYLRYKERHDALDVRIKAGDMTKEETKAAEDTKEDMQQEKDSIDVAKVRILNKQIFPAMANLTVLVEKMREHPYIRGVFEDDVKELFLQGSPNKPGWTIFHRFVEACLCKRERGEQSQADDKDSAALAPDFRAMLGEYMQRAVFEMMKEMMPLKFEDSYFREKIIIDDMTRPIVWSKYFAAEARMNLDPNLRLDKEGMPQGEHRRPALF